MKAIIFIKILISSFLMMVVVAQVTNSITYNSLISFIAYFYLSLIYLKIFQKEQPLFTVLAILFLSRFLIESYSIYLYLTESISGLPYFVMHLFAIASAYLYLRLKFPSNMAAFAASSVFVVAMFFGGWDYWIHRSNFGTFTGQVSFAMPAKFEAYYENHKLISGEDFANKVVLLDFWHTRCGICFKKFPYLEEFYLRNQGRKDILAIAVNKPLEEDKPGEAFRIIKEEEGYSFPVAVTKEEDMAEKFGVKGYPTTFVIDRQGMVVFKGSIEGAIRAAEELLK